MRDILVSLLRWTLHAIGVLLVFFSLFAAYSCVHTRRPPEPDAVDFLLDGPPVIRVGLSKWTGAAAVPIAIAGPYHVDGPKGERIAAGASLPLVDVLPTTQGLKAGQTDLGVWDALFVPEDGGTVIVESRKYHGSVRVWSVAGGKVSAASEVDLETYVGGVIGSEMSSNWLPRPDSALMAQAIAARTYAVWEMRHARVGGGRADGVDVWDDERSQVYAGLEKETPELVELTGKTRGVILAYDGKILHAFYSSTCGGRTEAAKDALGGPDIAPLSGRPCGYCDGSKHSTWSVTIGGKELAAKLHPGMTDPGPVRGLAVVERTATGRARTLNYTLGATTVKITSEELRHALGGRVILSLWFDVTPTAEGFRIDGRGFGHGVGMCQMGAKGMSDRHYDAMEILRYYYPGVDVVRIY